MNIINNLLDEQYVIKLFKKEVSEPNMLARLSGDEFVLALFGIEKLDQFIPQVEHYIQSIRRTYLLDEDEFFVTFSVGVALYPDNGKDYITLLRHADAAQSIAKAKGKDQNRHL